MNAVENVNMNAVENEIYMVTKCPLYEHLLLKSPNAKEVHVSNTCYEMKIFQFLQYDSRE